MAIATTCPNCKALFRLADELAGKKVKCQKCAQVFTVATADAKADPDASVKRAIDMEIDAPKAAAAPPDDEAPPDGAVMADDEPAVPSSKKAPPPPIGKKSKESPSRTRRAPSDSGSNVGLIAILIVLVGGGLFACAGACGIGGWFYYASEDKRAKPADPGPLAANKDDANKDGAKKEGPPPGDGKKAKLEPPPPLPPPPLKGGLTVVFGPDGTYTSENSLNQNDLISFNKRFKLYVVQLEAGQTYQLDMVARVPGLDPYLRLVDETNTILAEDDDGGGFPNARIIYRAPRTGTYRIHATYFGGLPKGPADYTLVVARQNAKK